jgi:hypothetical protein
MACVRPGWLMTVPLIVMASSACSDPTEDARPVTIKNDTQQTIVLRVCDSFGCENLNDRLRPGQQVPENVSTSGNPYRFQVTDSAGHQLGCLPVDTSPVPSKAVLVSSMERGPGSCR